MEANRLLLKFSLSCHKDIQESYCKNIAKFDFLEMIWRVKSPERFISFVDELSFVVDLHFNKAKNSLKSLVFSSKLATSLLCTFNGGIINGIFYHSRKFSRYTNML